MMNTVSTRFSAVLFDMDGVVIQSKPVIENAWRKVAKSHGREISDQEMHELVHGRPGSYTVDALFPGLSAAEKQKVRSLVDSIEERSPCASIGGVEDLIKGLISHGVVFGLVTSGWPARIEFVLQSLGLTERFSVVVSRDDVRRGKPDPEPYLLAASRLGLPASKAIVCEDSVSGVQAAVSAGAYCVGIGSDELVKSGARTVIRDFSGISLQPTSPGEVSLVFSTGHRMLLECAR
jgi:HAD superfamily hydrolase (TIGR01509 family)